MAYVPGFAHDLFLSYENSDRVWIRAMEESLRQQLRERLGFDVRIWQDENNIRLGQNWVEEIQSAVRSSAAFLAILSPSYRTSDWCARERKFFLDHCKVTDQLKVGTYHRFLKIVKMPWPNDSQQQFHQDLQHINFFERRATGEEIEFVPGTEEFRLKVRDTSRAIADLLREMRRRRESVFIASTTEECSKARMGLRDELRAQGYDVRPDGPLDDGFSDELIKQDIDPAVLSIHVLGGRYDPFVEHQIDLAIELEKRLLFWLTRDAETTRELRQRALLEAIRLDHKHQGKWTLLTSHSLHAVIPDLLAMLRPRPAPTSVSHNEECSRVYLLCDVTTPEDADTARQIQSEIQRTELVHVELPVADSPSAFARPDVHQQLLRECDGLLLYCKAAPDRWLFQMLPDVVYAERLVQRPPIRSKAFLLNDPSKLEGFSGVPVLPQSANFCLSDVEPFLSRLRTGGPYGMG